MLSDKLLDGARSQLITALDHTGHTSHTRWNHSSGRLLIRVFGRLEELDRKKGLAAGVEFEGFSGPAGAYGFGVMSMSATRSGWSLMTRRDSNRCPSRSINTAWWWPFAASVEIRSVSPCHWALLRVVATANPVTWPTSSDGGLWPV